LQALHGRHGECPLIVLAQATPSDGFDVILEAFRLSLRAMAPVIVLSDVCLVQSAEPWRVPSLSECAEIKVLHAAPTGGFRPYQRDAKGVRPWAIPGTPGLEHRTGGLEKQDGAGTVSFDPLNHEAMVRARADKLTRLAEEIPPLKAHGPDQGDLLVLGWGSTAGAIRTACEGFQAAGKSVAFAHVRHLHPLPKNVGDVLKHYRNVLMPELNSGQLASILRSAFLVDIVSLSKVQGEPFAVSEIERKIEEMLA
jgi:2-oxoglutarate/2-oxoacid ferredoxin oxidoreductase subunit alpha